MIPAYSALNHAFTSHDSTIKSPPISSGNIHGDGREDMIFRTVLLLLLLFLLLLLAYIYYIPF
jgi:hypothetical protein